MKWPKSFEDAVMLLFSKVVDDVGDNVLSFIPAFGTQVVLGPSASAIDWIGSGTGTDAGAFSEELVLETREKINENGFNIKSKNLECQNCKCVECMR